VILWWSSNATYLNSLVQVRSELLRLAVGLLSERWEKVVWRGTRREKGAGEG
jgi:hypothetical protein